MPKIGQKKRQARCLQILDAATLCFAREGFHCTSMEDIVRESKLSPGAIYCYFRGKGEIISAIAEQRHSRESALLAELAGSGSVSRGLQQLAQAFFDMLQDPKEKERRKVSVQIWAESLRDKRIRKIVERGLRQRDALTESLRTAQQAGQLPTDLAPDSFSRVMLALLQGFILQQAWEPELDTNGYLRTAARLITSVFSEASTKPLQSGCRTTGLKRTQTRQVR